MKNKEQSLAICRQAILSAPFTKPKSEEKLENAIRVAFINREYAKLMIAALGGTTVVPDDDTITKAFELANALRLLYKKLKQQKRANEREEKRRGKSPTTRQGSFTIERRPKRAN